MTLKAYKFKIKDLIQHHTIENHLKIEIIRGKGHSHLTIEEGAFSRAKISNSFKEVLDYAIEVLKDYRKHRNTIYKHRPKGRRRVLE
jgi:hypothetical protein